MDIAIPSRKVAAYIDGCLWHSCPEHFYLPKATADWWVRKMEMNRARDAASTAQLEVLGWTVLRFWEHEAPAEVAATLLATARYRTEDSGQQMRERVRALFDPDGGLRHARARAHHHPGDEFTSRRADGRDEATDPFV